MSDMFERVISLRVSDVMTRDPVVVSESDSMEQIATLFSREKRHAAPVVDAQGFCVGIVTASDFVKRCEIMSSDEGISHEIARQANGIHLVPKSYDFASQCMVRGVQSVAPSTPLIAAARIMSDAHLHVLPVLEQERPVGVVSNLDIVAALVNAYDEAKQSV